MADSPLQIAARAYRRAQKATWLTLAGLGMLGSIPAWLIGNGEFWKQFLFWEAFALLFGVRQCRLYLKGKKQAVIREAMKILAAESGMQCSEPAWWQEQQCATALFFPPYINGFYLERAIPLQLLSGEVRGMALQCSQVSCGTLFARAHSINNCLVLHERWKPSSFQILSTGLLFRCSLPFSFAENWLFLPRPWGRHMTRVVPEKLLLLNFHRTIPLPRNLHALRTTGTPPWVYSSSAPEPDPEAAAEYALGLACYARFPHSPLRLMSLTGHTIFLYLPFRWRIATERELQNSLIVCRELMLQVQKMLDDEITSYSNA